MNASPSTILYVYKYLECHHFEFAIFGFSVVVYELKTDQYPCLRKRLVDEIGADIQGSVQKNPYAIETKKNLIIE
jgi:hypothetical protein